MSGDSRDILEVRTNVAEAAESCCRADTPPNQAASNQTSKICTKLVSFQPGPFQIIDLESRGSCNNPVAPPRRRYSCEHYETCLDLAAALNWDNYTCRGCSGIVDQKLLWRARQEIRKDKFVRAICNDVPDIGVHSTDRDDPDDSVEAVG